MSLVRQRIVNTKIEAQTINFMSNDYLGLSKNPVLIETASLGAQKYGIGSTASPLLSGYYDITKELEQNFAEFLGREQAILFNSGYHANIGIMTALKKSGLLVFNKVILDKLCHASIIDGMLLSKVKFTTFKHNNYKDFNCKLNKSDHDLILAESIYSMEGDILDLNIINTAKNTKLITYVDDAHGLGLLNNGTGIDSANVDILVSPLGKAFASVGCIVSGSAELMDFLVQHCRSYIYSTALPPNVIYTQLKTLEIVKRDAWRRELLFANINYFNQQAKFNNIQLINYDSTPIRSILVGDNAKVVELKTKLHAMGISVSAIRPPTVPDGTARLRISLNCFHARADIDLLFEALLEVLL